MLGLCYYLGEGVAQDKQEGFKWTKKAAEQGSAIAQMLVGVSYSKGEGVAQDKQEATKWFGLNPYGSYR